MIPFTSIKYDPAKGHRAFFSRGGARVTKWIGPWRNTPAEAADDQRHYGKTPTPLQILSCKPTTAYYIVLDVAYDKAIKKRLLDLNDVRLYEVSPAGENWSRTGLLVGGKDEETARANALDLATLAEI
jgi:hypothetical protein